MARCTANKKDAIVFEHGNRYLEISWDFDLGFGLEIHPGYDGMPILTTNQARKLANRIIEWCDEAEENH